MDEHENENMNESKNQKCNCSEKKRLRTEEERRALTNRLCRIEGQIRGIIRMLEEDAYCIDVLDQVSAASSALSSFSRQLLESHIKGCVTQQIRAGDDTVADELVRTVARFMK